MAFEKLRCFFGHDWELVSITEWEERAGEWSKGNYPQVARARRVWEERRVTYRCERSGCGKKNSRTEKRNECVEEEDWGW